jgi:hypothetical protein
LSERKKEERKKERKKRKKEKEKGTLARRKWSPTRNVLIPSETGFPLMT